MVSRLGSFLSLVFLFSLYFFSNFCYAAAPLFIVDWEPTKLRWKAFVAVIVHPRDSFTLWTEVQWGKGASRDAGWGYPRLGKGFLMENRE